MIIYKFDYSSYENFKISLLTIHLNCFKYLGVNKHWIISIGTDTSNNSSSTKWIPVEESEFLFDHRNYYGGYEKSYVNLTKYVQKKIFFIKITANQRRPEDHQYRYELFQDHYGNPNNIQNNFELDINVELSPLSLNELTKSLNFNVNDSKLIIPKVENSLNFGGLFNDKYRFDVIQSDERKDAFLNRISYFTDAYYENGITDIKYLKKWDRGTFSHENLYCFSEM